MTESLAQQIGKNLRGGEVIELVSDLGGGKTTFVRGLVRGSGSEDKVASPTFTISREYKGGRFTIAHFDFYRLNEAGIMSDELKEIVEDPEMVTVIEWGEIVQDVLPEKRLTISFQHVAENERKLSVRCPLSLEYLLKGAMA